MCMYVDEWDELIWSGGVDDDGWKGCRQSAYKTNGSIMEVGNGGECGWVCSEKTKAEYRQSKHRAEIPIPTTRE